jgi:hypothetical protein
MRIFCYTISNGGDELGQSITRACIFFFFLDYGAPCVFLFKRTSEFHYFVANISENAQTSDHGFTGIN